MRASRRSRKGAFIARFKRREPRGAVQSRVKKLDKSKVARRSGADARVRVPPRAALREDVVRLAGVDKLGRARVFRASTSYPARERWLLMARTARQVALLKLSPASRRPTRNVVPAPVSGYFAQHSMECSTAIRRVETLEHAFPQATCSLRTLAAASASPARHPKRLPPARRREGRS